MGRRLPSNTLTLTQFMLRQKTLSLYKDFLKLISRLDDETTKKELKDWIRHDFKDNMHHKQEEIIKMHLTRGKTALKQLESTLSLSQPKR